MCEEARAKFTDADGRYVVVTSTLAASTMHACMCVCVCVWISLIGYFVLYVIVWYLWLSFLSFFFALQVEEFPTETVWNKKCSRANTEESERK